MENNQYDFVRTELMKLLNNKVVYGISEFTIVDFTFANNMFYIEVSDRDDKFEFPIERAVDFVRELKTQIITVAEKPKIGINSSNANKENSVHSDGNITIKLKNIVLDCIENIKKDRNYIGQANAINSQIQTLINLKKIEIEAEKLKLQLTKKG